MYNKIGTKKDVYSFRFCFLALSKSVLNSTFQSQEME
jgi:hypothetical protein